MSGRGQAHEVPGPGQGPDLGGGPGAAGRHRQFLDGLAPDEPVDDGGLALARVGAREGKHIPHGRALRVLVRVDLVHVQHAAHHPGDQGPVAVAALGRDELPGAHGHRGAEPEPDLLEGRRPVVADDGAEHLTRLVDDVPVDDIIASGQAGGEPVLVARLGSCLVVLAGRAVIGLSHHASQLTNIRLMVNGYQTLGREAITSGG